MRGVGRPPASGVHPALLGERNACGLALFGVLQFIWRDTEKQAGYQVPHRAAEVDLLRDRDHPYPRWHQSASTLTPSLRLRARRSSFQMTTVVISPAKMAACKR